MGRKVPPGDRNDTGLQQSSEGGAEERMEGVLWSKKWVKALQEQSPASLGNLTTLTGENLFWIFNLNSCPG